jgi:hypothetical protein
MTPLARPHLSPLAADRIDERYHLAENHDVCGIKEKLT